MGVNELIGIGGVVLTILSTVIMILKWFKSSKNAKVAKIATTALSLLYIVKDAMFKTEDKNYNSQDKRTVAKSITKEECNAKGLGYTDEAIDRAIDLVMEIGNNINKREKTIESSVGNDNATSNEDHINII